MATILPFKEFNNHINQKNEYRKALIDTCALISFSHDTNEFHDETLELFDILIEDKFQIYSNVNIQSEFIEFQRRLIITEALTSVSRQIAGILSRSEVARALKAHRANVQKRADEGRPLVLNDLSIKQFKKLLSFSMGDLPNIWLRFCHDNLSGRLEKTFDIVAGVLRFKYLSLRKGTYSPEVIKEVSWKNMYAISEKSGMGTSDSMILNMFECTDIPFLITTDFDLIYAGSLSDDNKLIFCPDRIYQDYKDNFINVL